MNPPLLTDAMRADYSEWLCETWEEGSARLEYVAFPGPSNVWNLRVAPPTVPAWELFAEAMAVYEYYFRESAGGTFNPRPIEGTDDWSLHAYGLAIDLNPSENPHGTNTTDMPKEFRDAVESITAGDRQVFKWGGDWLGDNADPMHWQIGATEREIASGVTWEGTDMPLSDADLAKIDKIVDDRIDAIFAVAEGGDTSRVSRAIHTHGGAYSGLTDPKDNFQLTVKRIESKIRTMETDVKVMKALLEELVGATGTA